MIEQNAIRDAAKRKSTIVKYWVIAAAVIIEIAVWTRLMVFGYQQESFRNQIWKGQREFFKEQRAFNDSLLQRNYNADSAPRSR